MGDNVTCVIVIIIPELSDDHTLILESMSFADSVLNEVTVYYTEF